MFYKLTDLRQSNSFSRQLVRDLALAVIVLCAALMVGCKGGGGGGGGSVSAPVNDGSQLYVLGNGRSTLLSYNDANTASGDTAPNRIVAGGNTTLDGPRGMAVDMARNQPYVANYTSNSILVFNNARTVTGGDAPSRTISSAALNGPTSLFVDVVNNRLYAANTRGNSVLIYDNASTANGGVAPTRTLSLIAPTGIFVDTTRNLLYVSNGTDRILVFNNAATLAGNVSPVRTIANLSGPGGIFIDVMADRLFVANTNSIAVFDNASQATSVSLPDRLLSGGSSLLNMPRDLFVDTNTDRLYVANTDSDSILVFNNASVVNNPATPDRRLNQTASTRPWGIYVDVTPVVIGSTANLDGYARSDGIASASDAPATGDKVVNAADISWRQLYSFDISSLPASATITAAMLRLYQCDVVGTAPYNLLGNIIVDQVDYSALDGTTYGGGTLFSNIGTLSTSDALGYRSLNVTARLQNDLALTRASSQYRLRFELRDFFANLADDYVRFTDAENYPCPGTLTQSQPPQLAVTIKL